ncbi:hypothetical protein PBI_SCTP2_429 [Salicola phage SCTP-2]|nr:hypothetical protein PBI_SCTP2_429 [Salicola phage SCTP-2]
MNFVIYGSTVCPYCKKAVNLIDREGHTYDYVNIQKNDQAREYIKEELSLRTVPQVFLNGERIGGYDDLVNFLQE